jgi:UPF0755 protein
MKFIDGKIKKGNKKIVVFSLVGIFALGLVISALVVRNTYNQNLKPLSNISKKHVVTIQPGSSTAQISNALKSRGVIKSEWAFEWYVRNRQPKDELKAGTYVFDQTQSVPEIVNIIIGGKVATDLVTILPGKRLEDSKADFIKAGFSHAEVEAAFEPSQYSSHPALSEKPKEATLEGYLYPETFQKTAETKLKEVILLSLDEMALRLTDEVKKAIAKQGLNVHQAIILASIIEGEVSSPEERALVAQVFEKRLKEGIRLESNATDEYAKINPAYDSYKIDGLPPGPISNFTESSLKAVAYPAGTDWLYFVTGDNGVTHFSKTLQEHEALVAKYCTTLCGR